MGCSEPGSVDGQAAERERGYLTGLWKKRGRKPILPPSFLPLFLSSSLRRRLIIVARQELKLFSWPVTSATPPPSFVVFVLALCRSLGGNFPAIRAHSLRLFLQAPHFLSPSVCQWGKASRRCLSYSPLFSPCQSLAHGSSEHLARVVFLKPEFHAGGDKSV